MNILILGATSAIARPCAEIFAARGDQLYLASRDQEELSRIATDLKVRFNTQAHHGLFDAEDITSHEKVWRNALEKMQHIDCVFVATGYMGTNEQAIKIINTNFTGLVSIINIVAKYFGEQRKGTIAVLSSVAGERGRQSNYIYGAAKSGMTTYLQGLRNYLFPMNVNVVTIKLGMVDTGMITEMKPDFIKANPKAVAKSIVKAIDDKKDSLYIPGFWALIMLIVRLVPEKIFKRLKL